MKQVLSDARVSDILPLAVWFGLAAGLIEGLVFLLFLFLLQFEWVSRDVLLPDVAVELIWISPLFNGLLFGAIGLGLIGLFKLARLARPDRRLPVVVTSVSLFSFLSFLDWLALLLSRRIHHLSLAILAAGLAATFTRYARKREERVSRLWRRSLPWLAAAVALVFAGVESGGWLRERMAISALASDRKSTLLNSSHVRISYAVFCLKKKKKNHKKFCSEKKKQKNIKKKKNK